MCHPNHLSNEREPNSFIIAIFTIAIFTMAAWAYVPALLPLFHTVPYYVYWPFLKQLSFFFFENVLFRNLREGSKLFFDPVVSALFFAEIKISSLLYKCFTYLTIKNHLFFIFLWCMTQNRMNSKFIKAFFCTCTWIYTSNAEFGK